MGSPRLRASRVPAERLWDGDTREASALTASCNRTRWYGMTEEMNLRKVNIYLTAQQHTAQHSTPNTHRGREAERKQRGEGEVK